ncbi:MAG: hypothetical protein WA639_18690 [Candidatus Acidiferrum sp.]
MLRGVLSHVLKLAVITVIFVPVAASLPLASLWLCRTPEGGQFLFWCGPWSCAFWSLILSVFVGSKCWRGREAVLAWRAERGGYVRSCMKSTGLMFGSLFLSYGCEFAYIFLLRSSPDARLFLPCATYAPAALALWSAVRG